MHDEMKQAHRNRGESFKGMLFEVFRMFEEAIHEGRQERALELRKSILDAVNSTVDDNSNLLIQVIEADEKIKAFRNGAN